MFNSSLKNKVKTCIYIYVIHNKKPQRGWDGVEWSSGEGEIKVRERETDRQKEKEQE